MSFRERWIYDRKLQKPVRVDEDYRPTPRQQVHLISDTTEPFKSMADGKVYDSKSRYRAELKARGLVEVGSDSMESVRKPEPESPRAAIERALARHS